MEFKKVKKYLNNCGEEFAFCINKLAVNNTDNIEINNCLSSSNIPDLSSIEESLITMQDFDLETSYVRYIVLVLLALKREDAKVIWENYFYRGKKESYYERSVDYRHRVKASLKFYTQIINL